MKFFIRSLLLLCFLLWGGYSYGLAQVQKHTYALRATLPFGTARYARSQHSARNTSKLKATEVDDEDEDDDLLFSRKDLAFSHYFTGFFNDPASGCFRGTFTYHHADGAGFLSCFSPGIYIVYRVIRI